MKQNEGFSRGAEKTKGKYLGQTGFFLIDRYSLLPFHRILVIPSRAYDKALDLERRCCGFKPRQWQQCLWPS